MSVSLINCVLKSNTITGTTTGAGNFVTDLPDTLHIVCANCINRPITGTAGIVVTPYIHAEDHAIIFRCLDASGEKVSSKTVQIEYFYYE